MRKSYCGLCDDCSLGRSDFLEALTRVKEHVDNFRVHWWSHCFPEEEGFSFPEFRKGLEWLLNHTQCPSCSGGRGLDHCPIRRCAMQRRVEQCSECPDLETCDKYSLILKEFPDLKNHLLRCQLKLKAREFHSRRK